MIRLGEGSMGLILFKNCTVLDTEAGALLPGRSVVVEECEHLPGRELGRGIAS